MCVLHLLGPVLRECLCERVALLSHTMCNSEAEDKHTEIGLHFESASVNNNNNNNYKNLKTSSNNNNNDNDNDNDNDNNNDIINKNKNTVKMKQMKRHSALEVPRKKSPPQLLKSLSLNNGRAMYEEQEHQHHHGRLAPATKGFACFCCQPEELYSDERVKTW